MARPLRLEFAGALYHVTSRGNGRDKIYLTDADWRLFLDVLAGMRERYNWTVHSYCLVSNRYHILVETPDANLSKGMRQLNGVYTQRFNRTHDRVGHVFQGRYKAILVQKETYFLEVARYVVLNPVRARMVHKSQEWPWSSYRAMIGLQSAPDWLETRAILAAFGPTEEQAVRAYVRFVAEGEDQPSPWEQLKHLVFLGTDAFVESMRGKVPGGGDLREISQAKPIARYARRLATRNHAIIAAYASGGHTMQSIGDYFGLHYSRVSKIINAADQARLKAKEKI